MLNLSRRKGESINIGDNITITVLNIRHGDVLIGTSAPKCIPVHRQEIYERIRLEKQHKELSHEKQR